MLQQTPVSRVLPVFIEWLDRWPTPATCADASAGDAIRVWGRLGYPRRALWLHQSAKVCAERWRGAVPDTVAELRLLPGVGEYTAAAVASFAFGQRHAVLDTNVRRVYSRLFDGEVLAPVGPPAAAERARALKLLPLDPQQAAACSVAVMEFGALCCTTRDPACSRCPVSRQCAWFAAGRPEWKGAVRRGQRYAGTDRECRGRLLGLVRGADEPVAAGQLAAVWSDREQRERALTSLVADGLLVQRPNEPRYSLP